MDAPSPQAIPENPGVYLYKDAGGKILYVGKAKNLRRRVMSYFSHAAAHSPKTIAMLAAARSLDTILTTTEKEALLLEAGLIKKHRPRYNIVLRDDKGYVLFRLDTGSDYPRLSLTRRVSRDGATYYGPFTSAAAAHETLKAVLAVFPLRRCKESVFRNRVRPCLYHHMNLCLAPCSLDVDRELYGEQVRGVQMLLAGRTKELVAHLTEQMRAASDDLRFEKAAELRDRIRAVRRTVEQQSAVLSKPRDLDVVGVAAIGGRANADGEDQNEPAGGLSLELLFVRRGLLLGKRNYFWPELGEAEAEDAVGEFVLQHYRRGRFVPEKIVLPKFEDTDDQGEEKRIPAGPLAEALAELRGGAVRVGPPRGKDEQRLAQLASANALQDAETAMGAHHGRGAVLARLAAKLGLTEPPRRIEGVDISHTSGGQMRAGMVVYEDGLPLREAYRVYSLENCEPGDDYGALAEWAERRVESGPPWPDLLVVDGGRGQLAAVERVLQECAPDREWRLASVAKEHAQGEGGRSGAARRHGGAEDRVFLPGRRNPVNFRAKDPALLLLRDVRDAVHRLSISRHRKARGRASLGGTLTSLPGVGPKTAKLLWERYAGLEEMNRATVEELAGLPGFGPKKARALHEALGKLVSGDGGALDGD